MKRSYLLAIPVLVLSMSAHAANLNVYCGQKRLLPNSINAALKLLNPQGPNALTVYGKCKENVLIQGWDRLTLMTTVGATAASITDASNGSLPVIDIEDSRGVTVQGFTINGGADGILCYTSSICYLTGNTVQASVGQEGIGVFHGAHATLSGNTIKSNTQRGMTVANGAQAFTNGDTFQDNVSAAVVVNSGGYLNANSCMIQNNGSDGSPGVLGSDRSTLRLVSCTISNNGGDGVTLQRSAEARFDNYYGPTTISGNSGNGVTVRDLSFAGFGPSSIIGNLTGTDVLCMPQFSATRGALTNIGGGSTNCVEP